MGRAFFWTCTGVLMLLLSLAMYEHNYFSATASPTTIRVPHDVATIQAAIEVAVAGDTILVSEGEYPEGQINITKSVTLHGEGIVIADGLFESNVFLIYSSRCNASIVSALKTGREDTSLTSKINSVALPSKFIPFSVKQSLRIFDKLLHSRGRKMPDSSWIFVLYRLISLENTLLLKALCGLRSS